jgi:hypothetical protein
MPAVEFNLGGTLRFLVEEEIYSVVTLAYQNFTITARGQKMSITIPVDYGIKVHIAYVDNHGNPAVIDGAVDWVSSDPNIADVKAQNPDGTDAIVAAGSKVGQVQITATADADLGAGVRELATLLDVIIVAGEAVAGTISPVGELIPPTVQPL